MNPERNPASPPSTNEMNRQMLAQDGNIFRHRELMRNKYDIDPTIPIICHAPKTHPDEFITSKFDSLLVPLDQSSERDTGIKILSYFMWCHGEGNQLAIHGIPVGQSFSATVLGILSDVALLFTGEGRDRFLEGDSTLEILCTPDQRIIYSASTQRALIRLTSELGLNSEEWAVCPTKVTDTELKEYSSGPLRHRESSSIRLLDTNGTDKCVLTITHMGGTFGTGTAAELLMDSRVCKAGYRRIHCVDPYGDHLSFYNALLSEENFRKRGLD